MHLYDWIKWSLNPNKVWNACETLLMLMYDVQKENPTGLSDTFHVKSCPIRYYTIWTKVLGLNFEFRLWTFVKNMGRSEELNEFRHLIDCNKSVHEISSLLDIPWSSVNSITAATHIKSLNVWCVKVAKALLIHSWRIPNFHWH